MKPKSLWYRAQAAALRLWPFGVDSSSKRYYESDCRGEYRNGFMAGYRAAQRDARKKGK